MDVQIIWCNCSQRMSSAEKKMRNINLKKYKQLFLGKLLVFSGCFNGTALFHAMKAWITPCPSSQFLYDNVHACWCFSGTGTRPSFALPNCETIVFFRGSKRDGRRPPTGRLAYARRSPLCNTS